jgi:hypothetical protein
MSHGVGMTKTRLQREDRNILDLQYRQISVTTIPLGVGGTNTNTLQKKGDGEEQIQGHRRWLSLQIPPIRHPEGETSYYQPPAGELKYITMHRRRLSLRQVAKGELPHIRHPEGQHSYYQPPAGDLKYVTRIKEPYQDGYVPLVFISRCAKPGKSCYNQPIT